MRSSGVSMAAVDSDDVWGPLIAPGDDTRSGAVAVARSWSPEYLDRTVEESAGHATVEGVLGAAPAWGAAPAHTADPFEHYVPPALLPLDDVSLGLADELEGTGWIEAGGANPLGGYMAADPFEVEQSRTLARGRAAFAGLDLMGGPQRVQLTRVERNRLGARLTWARRLFAFGVLICMVGVVIGAIRSHATAAPPAVADARPAEGSATLLIQKDGAALTAVTLLVSQPGGGRVILVPTGVSAVVPGVGPATLAAATADPAITTATVADTLGVRIDHWIQTDSFGLEQLFGTYGTLPVEAPTDVVAVRSAVRPGAGVDTELSSRSVSVHAGHNDLDAHDSVAYMNAMTADGELARLARQADVWKAFLGRLRDEPQRAAALLGANRLMTSDDTEMREVGAVLGGLAGASAVEFGVLPVVATARAADGTEAFRPDTAGVARTVASLPTDVVVEGQKPRLGLTVSKGVGAGTIAGVVRSVVPTESDLVLSSATDAAYDETLIVYYREAQRPAAEALRNRLGIGRVVKDLRDQDVVDVSVTLGSDAERAHSASATEQQPAAGIDDITNAGPG